MKKFFAGLVAIIVASVAFAQPKLNESVKFKTETIDLGTMKVNVPKTAVFEVQNIGKTPLIIETASPTCGCTVGDYTKAPIAAGQWGKITATFNAAALGDVQKSMTVKFAGIDEVKSIHFTGKVLSEADFAKQAAAKNKKRSKKH